MPETKTKILNIPLLLNIFLALIFAALLGIGVWFFLKTTTPETIAVSGMSSTAIKNEILTFSLSIEETNSDKVKAVDALTERSKTIVQMIKDFGIPEKDIETTNLSVYQRQDQIYRNGVTTYEPGDWTASYTITAKLRDLERSAEFTSLLTSVEKASMWGPTKSIDNSSINEEELLSAAIEDARAKADAIAAGVGKKLGKAIQISESSYAPVYGLMYRDAGMGAGGGGDIPIEPGTTETYKSVYVVFELK
ncbi:MAG: hypothetical protein KatS3mg101_0606 [Patescibacteria group bacterium]|nr:MAG: hypothetical protein KatS3mg101_0606 [Patescibacteria group bacterium]